MPDTYTPTKRSKVKRLHQRGHYDKETVFGILDRNPLGHVGYVIDGQPYVTPTLQWREGDRVYWHGTSASRMLRTVKGGIPATLTVTRFNGFVLARSPFHHSANYESAMLFGTAHPVEGRAAKERSLEIMMEHFFPGRWAEVRGNTEQEMKATLVVSMEIEEASAKIRTGPPVDDDEDYDTVAAWAGVLPLESHWGQPVDDGRLKPGVAVPDYLSAPKVFGEG